jgi:hypothetical protein
MKYRVKSASVFGKGHKIWSYGEIVDGEEFVATPRDDERPEQLVRDGFLEPIEEDEIEEPKALKAKSEKKRRGPKPGKKREKIETASESLEKSLAGIGE